MIVGFDASRAFITHRTGTENYSFQILKHLSLIDHQNTYYVYLRPGVKMDEKEWPKNFHFFTINFPRFWTQLGLSLHSLKDPLDVLFVPAHTLPIIRKPGLKTVVTVHDLGAEFLPQTHQIKQRLYLNFMTNHQLRSATHLIAVSQATKEDLINKANLPSSKISVVYEGYNQDLKFVTNDTLRKVLRHYDLVTQGYHLFVGTIQPRKNLQRLIQAFAKSSSNSSLVLAGGKGWLAEDIYGLPAKLKIEQQVRFLGYVPDTHLPALYSGAKDFLFPSLFEGFGLPILEAFSCGCPVLTSNVSSMPEVAGQAAVLVDPYSVDSITQGIEKIQNKQLRVRLIKQGYSQLKKFSWEKAAQETLKVLKQVANSK